MHIVNVRARRARWSMLFALGLTAHAVAGDTGGAYTLQSKLQFIAGDANMRKGLSRQPPVRDLVAGEFLISVFDLDDDGKQEIILVGSTPAFCGSGGCLTVVLRNTGSDQLEPIFQQNLFPDLGVTRQKANGYRLLAALDRKGGIAHGERRGTPLFGKPMVYPMTVASTAPVATAATTPAGAAPGEPAPESRPAASVAGIDVLGIRPGASSVAEVRRALAAVRPALSTVDTEMRLAGRSPSAGSTSGPIEVGDRPFLRQISAYTGNAAAAGRCNVAPAANCEKILVSFSGPPSEGTAQIVYREMMFGSAGPTFENMLASLTEKYGAPGFQQAFGDGGRARYAFWAWDAAGRRIALNERHPCSDRRGAIAAPLMLPEELKRATVHVNAGCATTLTAEYGGLNGIVSSFKIVAVDHRGIRERHTSTSQYVDELVAAKERNERKKADAVAVPTL